MSNAVVQWQIITKDPEASARFYGKLFGWKINTDNALGYRQVAASEGGIAGGIWPAPPSANDFVQLFVKVDDLDRAVADATALGARVIVPPSVLPDGDAMAVLLDPSGLSFGMMRSAS